MFTGTYTAIVTPFKNGSVDEKALERLVKNQIRGGVEGIVPVGTTGESPTVDYEEHVHVIALTVRFASGKVKVIAGTGANSTREAIDLTRCAQRAGADACLLVTPYYNKPTQEGLYLHHRAVAEAVDIPQILYNVPGRTACDMRPETAARLAEIGNIIGIKEATGELDRVARLRDLTDESFMIYSGDDATARELMLLGGNGVISVTANVAPAAMHALCAAALTGDATKAEALDRPLRALHRDLFVEANPIPVKWALCEMGLIGEGIRLPLTWLSEGCRGQVRAALVEAGIL